MFAAGGEDDQISLWDLAVERDEMEVDQEVKVVTTLAYVTFL